MSFKPMLADAPETKFPLRFPFLASPKYDGIRCIIRSDGPVSRKLKPIPNRALRSALSHDLLAGFDGELLAGPPYDKNAMQATTSAVMSHEGDFSQVKFYVFDRLNWANPDMGYWARREQLVGWFEAAQKVCPIPLVLVEQYLVNNEDELAQYEQVQINLGYEGVIIRAPHGKYKFGRSTAKEQLMLKIKRFVDTEGEVVGFFEQMTNTNEQTRDELGYAKRSSAQDGKVGLNTLGGMIVKLGPEWNSQTVDVGTGQGWTKEFRQRVWDNQDQYLGKWLKYKYQECGSLDAPRLPIGLGFRDEADMGEGEL